MGLTNSTPCTRYGEPGAVENGLKGKTGGPASK